MHDCLSFAHTLFSELMGTKKALEAEVQPRPTVRDAMRLTLAGAKLVAGSGGLDHPIEWVRLMETPEVQPRAGDLMFTTGFPIKDNPEAQIRLVRRIAESGGAGLVVRPLPYIRKLPPEMLSEADRLNVPLFTVGADVALIDLMTPLLERIINAEHWRLKRSMEIHRRFTELVLDGKGVNEICRTLAELLESAVVVEDASFHLLAHAGGSTDPHRKETILRQGTPQRVLFDPQIQRTLREVEAKRGPVKVPAFPHLGMSRERLIAPILAANQVLGYISILDHPPHNEELAFMAIEQAALVLALSVAKERELSEVEGRVRGEFLEDLLHGTYGEEAAAQRRARHLGYPLQGSHIVMLVDIDDFRGFNKTRQISEDAIQALKREFLRRVTGVVRISYSRALVQGRSDQVVSLLPLGTEGGDYQVRAHALGLQIQQAITEWKPGFTVSVGFSGPAEAPTGVAGSLREVTSVMESLARFKRWSQVVAVPELGLTGLLAAVTDERLVDYSRRHLGPLIEHDTSRKGNLVATLRAYLETGEQQQAAKRLRVHPNTLRYRLDRIREISGVDLEDPETRLNLAVALRVQALLGM
jgi:purine catabolism regulator